MFSTRVIDSTIEGGEIDVEHISPRFYSAKGVGIHSEGIELTSGPDSHTRIIPNHTFMIEVIKDKHKTVFEISKAIVISEADKKDLISDGSSYTPEEELAEIENLVTITLTDQKQREGFIRYLKNVIGMLEKL